MKVVCSCAVFVHIMKMSSIIICNCQYDRSFGIGMDKVMDDMVD